MILTMLKPNAKSVLITLIACPTLDDLAIAEIVTRTGLCNATVRTHLKMLKAHGYINTQRPNSRSRFSFEIRPKAYAELSPDDNR